VIFQLCSASPHSAIHSPQFLRVLRSFEIVSNLELRPSRLVPNQRSVFLTRILVAAAVSLVSLSAACADFKEFRAIPLNEALGATLQRTADGTTREFPRLTPENIGLSLIDLTKSDAPSRADFRGDASYYPASVIKLFFMAEIFRQGKRSPEIDRALHEMIAVSDNDAASYLVDVLSNTTSGPELDDASLRDFVDRHRAINRVFGSLGYDISAMAKPWSFGPYGRDNQLLGPNKENRNRATPNAVASLLYSIVRRHAVSPSASDAMMSLLHRPLDPLRPTENQVKDFLGESLPPGSKLWSKSGDTSEVRNDACYIELPKGRKLIVVVFTRAGDDKQLLPAIGSYLLRELR
jgi:beta-lactamase class A